jgi:hypothetical protein
MQNLTRLKPDEQDYVELITAVLKSGCQPRHPRYPSKGGEGLNYLATQGGQFWLQLLDVDPASIKRLTALHPDWASATSGGV